MKKFKETIEEMHNPSKQAKLAHDIALISEAGEDICAIPIDMLKSKVLKDRHKKLCKGTPHWSNIKKKKFNTKSIWSKAAQRAAFSKGHKLYNSLDEADIQNLIVHIQDITKDMIMALKRNDQRTVNGLYKSLGRVIK